jgi:hypothetical protein
MKLILYGRPISSNEKSVEEPPLCHEEQSSEDFSTLPHRINTNEICLLCGEFGHNRELCYHCIVSSGLVQPNADTVVNFK